MFVSVLPAFTNLYGIGWDGDSEVQVLVPEAEGRWGGNCGQRCRAPDSALVTQLGCKHDRDGTSTSDTCHTGCIPWHVPLDLLLAQRGAKTQLP